MSAVVALLSSLCESLEAERASIATLDHARLRALVDEREASLAAVSARVGAGGLSDGERAAARAELARLRGLLRGQLALYQAAFAALGEAMGLVAPPPSRRPTTYDARARLHGDRAASSAVRGAI